MTELSSELTEAENLLVIVSVIIPLRIFISEKKPLFLSLATARISLLPLNPVLFPRFICLYMKLTVSRTAAAFSNFSCSASYAILSLSSSMKPPYPPLSISLTFDILAEYSSISIALTQGPLQWPSSNSRHFFEGILPVHLLRLKISLNESISTLTRPNEVYGPKKKPFPSVFLDMTTEGNLSSVICI